MKNVRLSSKPTFQIDCLWLQPSALFETFQSSLKRPCSGPEIDCYMGNYVQANREYDKTKNWSTSAHQSDFVGLIKWGLENFNRAILRANMPLALDFPIVQ